MKQLFSSLVEQINAVRFFRGDYHFYKKNLEDKLRPLLVKDSTVSLEYLKQFILDAKESLKQEEEKKRNFINLWKDNIPKIFLGWFFIVTLEHFTAVHVFIKYLILLVGFVITASTIISVALKSEKITFARECIKAVETSPVINNPLCFYKVQTDIFYDDHGLTKYYKSNTNMEIKQMYLCLLVLCCIFVFDLARDFIKLISHVSLDLNF